MLRSIVIIAIASLLQPYIVLFPFAGPSSACMDCLIIEQTFSIAVLYLILPLCFIYLITLKLKLNPVLQAVLIVVYYIPVSFVKLTIPIFKDRIAAWSTYSEDEIWHEALIFATPALLLVSLILFFLLNKANKQVSAN